MNIILVAEDGTNLTFDSDDLRQALGITQLEAEVKALSNHLEEFLLYANEVDGRVQEYMGMPMVTANLQMHLKEGELQVSHSAPMPDQHVMDSLLRVYQMASAKNGQAHPALGLLDGR